MFLSRIIIIFLFLCVSVLNAAEPFVTFISADAKLPLVTPQNRSFSIWCDDAEHRGVLLATTPDCRSRRRRKHSQVEPPASPWIPESAPPSLPSGTADPPQNTHRHRHFASPPPRFPRGLYRKFLFRCPAKTSSADARLLPAAQAPPESFHTASQPAVPSSHAFRQFGPAGPADGGTPPFHPADRAAYFPRTVCCSRLPDKVSLLAFFFRNSHCNLLARDR